MLSERRKHEKRILNKELAEVVAQIRHAHCILIAEYPSDDIPMDWLKYGITRKGLEEAEKGKE